MIWLNVRDSEACKLHLYEMQALTALQLVMRMSVAERDGLTNMALWKAELFCITNQTVHTADKVPNLQ